MSVMSSKWKSRPKSAKSGGNSSKDVDDSSKAFQLSKNRFVSVSEFRSQIRVDVREFYFDDNGDRRPGKKGISLSMEEWNKLKAFLPKIEKAIKGIDDSESDRDSDEKQENKKDKKNISESDSEEEQKASSKKKKDSESDEDSDEPKKKSKKSKDSSPDSESVCHRLLIGSANMRFFARNESSLVSAVCVHNRL